MSIAAHRPKWQCYPPGSLPESWPFVTWIHWACEPNLKRSHFENTIRAIGLFTNLHKYCSNFFLKIELTHSWKKKSLVATKMYSRRSPRSINFPQADNFTVAFSAWAVVDLFTYFRENPAELQHKKKRYQKGKFCCTVMFPLHRVRVYKRKIVLILHAWPGFA